ncbi:MAG: AmmeMemoRadiSam system protein A [Gammaproteobacteria bacterium]|nr:AmmeMemoRadiSam system protein A [Gammaproteobacteria bacterium]
MPLSEAEQALLLRLALASLREGLSRGRPLRVDAADYPEVLRTDAASFVTLNYQGQLRGCIGHLQAIQPLVKDVVDNAYAAGFQDPRFPPLSPAELANLEIHISVLSPAEPLRFDSEAHLLSQLRPGVDGLILEDGGHRGTFLPAVWQQLPRPELFWRHLKLKAGLPSEHWSAQLRVWRYTSFAFGAAVAELSGA